MFLTSPLIEQANSHVIAKPGLSLRIASDNGDITPTILLK
jgi:hypothetical protein